MNTTVSARNQFQGKVSAVRSGGINDEVTLDIGSGQSLVATVTKESRESLRLAEGIDAIALIKASSVLLVTDGGGLRFSARNQLSGTVSGIERGGVNSEVQIGLPGGSTVVAVVTNASAKNLGLAAGKLVTALFKASSVMLARKM